MSNSETMQFEYDPERLIEEVRKRPGIWDYGHINYRTMATRVEMWNDVVRELLQPNIQINKTEMRELVLQLQKKWKSIKDSFLKYVQNPNRTKRPYIYSKQMSFMLKQDADDHEGAAAEVASSGSDDAPLKSRKRKKAWNRKPKVVIKTEVSDEDNNDDVEFLEEDSFSHDEEKAPKAKNAKTVDEFAFANVSNMDSSVDDCDKMFLLSLLPHLKSIPEDMRLNAKMELLRVLKNANLEYNGDF